MTTKIYHYLCTVCVVCGLLSCSDDKDFGNALPSVTLISEVETNVGNVVTLAPGMTQQVTAEIKTQGVTNPQLVWTAVDPTVATVSADGLVTALVPGQTNINVTQYPNENVLKSFTVMVKPVATSISLNTTSLYQRTSKQLTVNVTPAGGFDLFDWSSSDETIAKVDANGVITASNVNYGFVTITAKSKDGSNLTSSATIEIKEIVPVTSIVLNGPGYDLGIGDQGTIATTLVPADATVDLLEWKSSDESIVTVSSAGVVKGVSYGVATITAKAENGVTQTIDITVGEGTINKVFADGLGSWTLEPSGLTYSLGDGYTIVQMQNGSKWRGDFGPSTGVNNVDVTLNVGVYRYFAVKMTRTGAYAANWNGSGTIVLDTAKGRYQQNQGNGNNRYSILGYEGHEGDCPMTDPAVIYFDLQSTFGTSGFYFSTTGTETVNLFKILVADVPTDYPDTYNLYWAHTFKTLEEMQAFVNNEKK